MVFCIRRLNISWKKDLLMQIRQDLLPNKRSTEYCTFLECNLVTWKSKKQILVARSSIETKYRAMAQRISELTLLRHFLQKIGFSILTPIPLYCYNQVVGTLLLTQCFMREQSTLKLIVIPFEIKY